MTAYEIITEVLLKSGLILALGLIVNWSFRHAAPKFRYRLWMPIFLIVLALPILLMFPRWEIIPPLSSDPPAAAPSQNAIGFIGPEPTFEIIGDTKPAHAPLVSTPQREWDWRLIALISWATGVSILLLRMLAGFFRLAHWRSTARGETPPPFMIQCLDDLQAEFGITRKVNLILSRKVGSPFAWGWIRPLVALPLEAASWSDTEIEMVLRHELTHLARRDSLNVTMAGLVTALNWPNPFAWLASKQVTELQELICDTEVLTAGCNADQYAKLLYSHARTEASPFSATAMARPGNLEKRITMILNSSSQLGSTAADKNRKSRYLALTGLTAISMVIVFLGLARPARAEPSGNQRLIIHTHNDGGTAEIDRLNFELNGEELEFDQLKKALQPIAKQNTVLALVPRAPLPMDQLKRVIDVAESAGIRYLIFEKPEIPRSGGHGDHEVRKTTSRQQTIRRTMVPVAGGNAHATTIFMKMNEPPRVESPLVKKLNAILVPEIKFIDTSLQDALDFLQQRSEDLDDQAAAPELRGVNIVIKGDTQFRKTPVTLSLSRVSLAEALHFTAELANAEIRVDENALFLEARRGSRRSASALGDDPAARAVTEKKLDTIVIPSIEFTDTPLREALAYLRSSSVERDAGSSDPNVKGINLVLSVGGKQGSESNPVTLRLKNIKLGDAIRYTADLADHHFQVRGNTVVVQPKLPPGGGGAFGNMSGGFESGGHELSGTNRDYRISSPGKENQKSGKVDSPSIDSIGGGKPAPGETGTGKTVPSKGPPR